MAAVNQNIGKPSLPFIAGDDLTIVVTTSVIGPGGVVTGPLNLTGAAIRWEAFPWEGGPKYGVPSSTPAIVKVTGGGGITITDAVAGEFKVALVPADTATIPGTYFHEAQVVVSGKTYTVTRGLLVISYQRVA